MPTTVFSGSIWFLIPISRGKCPFCPSCGRPCDHWRFFIRFHKQGQLFQWKETFL